MAEKLLVQLTETELTEVILKCLNKHFAYQVKVTQAQIEQQHFIDSLPDNLQTKHLKQIFGKSPVTFWAWEKKKLLRPQIIRNRKYYRKADVLALLHQKQTK